MSLETMARLWFNRSPAQHAVIVKNIKRKRHILNSYFKLY